MNKVKTTINVDIEVKDFIQTKNNVSKFINDLIKQHMLNESEVYQKTKFQQRKTILEKISKILKEEF